MSIFINSKVTETLFLDREQLKMYGEKLSELKGIAEAKEPNGILVTVLIGEREKYTPINRLINDLASINKYYSIRALQSNPELIQEYAEILNHIKNIDSIVSKRKKILAKKRKNANKENEEQEAQKNKEGEEKND